MRWIKTPFLLLTLAALVVTGCSQQTGPVSPAESGNHGLAFGYVLPEGATLTSATLNLHVVDATFQSVEVFRLTRDWDEATTTWNNFNLHDGGAFDPTVLASFDANVSDGYVSVVVTDQVLSWMNGDSPNLGFLLKQTPVFSPRTEYFSRERGEDPPFLEIVYALGGDTYYAELAPLADTEINESLPDTPFGFYDKLYTGWRNELEKDALIRFDLDVVPPGGGGEGCTHTIGFWKTHAGFGPQDDVVTGLLGAGIWLGDAGGDKSLAVTDAQIAYDLLRMRTYGTPSNGITKLYAQLLGAKLSIADDASDGDVAAAIATADAFLADHDWNDWEGLGTDMQAIVLDWQGTLGDYNNGDIGPGHCD